MALIAKPLRGLFFGLFCVFTLFGTSMTLVGAALPRILSDFRWSYAAAGAVIAASAAAYFPASLAAGKVLQRLGIKATMLLGLALCAFGLAFFAARASFLVNLVLNALIGAGQGLIEPTVNVSMLKMDEGGSGRPMNLMHGAFAVGAVVGPLVLGLILATGLTWTIIFRAIALLFAILAAVLSFLRFSGLDSVRQGTMSRTEQGGRSALPGRGAAFYLGFVCLLLYVGAELGISNWIAEYFVRIFAARAAFASLTVSLFWIGLLAGRFGVPALYRGKRPEILLVGSSLLLVASTVALCALGFASGNGAAAGPKGLVAASALVLPAALTFLSGLGCSIIYPTVMSLVGASCEGAQAEAISFAAGGGGIGLFAFPFLMSWIAQGYGIRVGFVTYALIAALTASACAVLAKVFAGARRSA
jgi:fucose permease